ncbi:MAG: hypothetical protein NW241_03815 [Bacteroidia bacterium]|nr:hypothetical protein [Bacteroidia bacterium]
MNPSPDYEAQAALFQQAMQEALARVDAVQQDLRRELDAAIEARERTRELCRRTERMAERRAQGALDRMRSRLAAEIREETLRTVVRQLFRAGRSAAEIAGWLELPPDLVSAVRMEQGIAAFRGREASVLIDGDVRGGTVIFRQDALQVSFPYEMAGGDALVLILAPPAAHWTAQTGLPPEERIPLLEYVAAAVVRQAASGGSFRIEADSIVIYGAKPARKSRRKH